MRRPLDSVPLRAVVTADIVNSTEGLSATQRKELASTIRKAYKRLQGAIPGALPRPIAVYGGDSWQCYVHDPAAGLRAGLYLRAWTRATFDVDTRFALAVDTVDFVDGKNVGESDGNAFRTSGRMAADLSGDERLAISVLLSVDDSSFRRLEAAFDDVMGASGDATARLADHIARGWTSAQAQAVAWRLLDPKAKNEDVGAQWLPEPVSHQSISKHLQRGGWEDILDALQCYERTVKGAVEFYDWLAFTAPR